MTDLYALDKAVDRPDFAERHFTVVELAKMWGCGGNTIRRWFRDEPGVLKFGHRSVNPRKKKKDYVSLRIPQHVAQRVYDRHVRGEWSRELQ